MKAIGVFGGAFSPFHYGHLRLAIEARELLGLDQVRLIPTAHPPHRPDARVSPARRLEWLKLAIRRERGLAVDDCELQRPGLSYTVDTLASLRERFPRASLVLLMGADAFAHLHTWQRWQALFEFAHVAVVSRPGAGLTPSAETAGFLNGRQAAGIDMLHREPAGSWLQLELPLLDISSTRIRRLLKARRSIRGLVPDVIIHHLTAADLAALIQDDDATTH